MEFSFKKVIMYYWLVLVEDHALMCADTEKRFQIGAYKSGDFKLAADHAKNVGDYHMKAVQANQDRRLLGRIF